MLGEGDVGDVVPIVWKEGVKPLSLGKFIKESPSPFIILHRQLN